MLIIVTGAPGGGKTTLAQRLSGDLKMPLISKDAVKETLYDTVGFRSRDEKVALGIAALDIAHRVAEGILAVGGDVIIENNYEYATRDKLLKLISHTGAKTLTILVDCETDVLVERVNKRDASPERHRGHVVNAFYPEPPGAKEPPLPFAADQYEKAIQARGFRDFSVGGERIVADTTNLAQNVYEELLPAVRAYLSAPQRTRIG